MEKIIKKFNFEEEFTELAYNLIKYVYFAIKNTLKNRKQGYSMKCELKYPVNIRLFIGITIAGIIFSLWHLTKYIINIEGKLWFSVLIGVLSGNLYIMIQNFRQAKWCMMNYPLMEHFLYEYKLMRKLLIVMIELIMLITVFLCNVTWFLSLPENMNYSLYLVAGIIMPINSVFGFLKIMKWF